MITMTRRVGFSAAHSERERENQSGPARSSDGSKLVYRGHDYLLDVSVCGKIDPLTGILINIKELDRIVREQIVKRFDGKLIDRQLAEFQCLPVTPENLISSILVSLNGELPAAVQLCRLKLMASPTDSAEWTADETSAERAIRVLKEAGAMILTRGYEFAASHRLHSPHLSADENRELFGKCNYEYGHGHNYEIEVTVAGRIDARSGRVIDPDALDAVVQREVIERYDHRHFNYDIPEFESVVPSAEIITRTIWNRLEPHIPPPARLYRVLVRETPRNIFEYYGEA